VTHFFLEQSFDTPLTDLAARATAQALGACLRIHHEWRECFVDCDRRRMLCHFEAQDPQALREASHRARNEPGVLWPGAIYSPLPAGLDLHAPGDRSSYVIGERNFAAPLTESDLAGLYGACAWCFEVHRVHRVRLIVAQNRRRAVALFRAPDAESVRLACQHAGTPLDRVWPCRRIGREDGPRGERSAGGPRPDGASA
jgi:Protein of unknown function (DUF4242)